MLMQLEHIQQALRDEKLDGWLFYDFRKSNPVAYQVLSLPFDAFYTRRWFYFIPAQGNPTALVSAVESHVLGELPGNRAHQGRDRKSTRLNSSHVEISYAVFCLKKKITICNSSYPQF